MSGELEGVDAFDKLLDRLTDAQRDFNNEQFLKENAEQRARAAEESAKTANAAKTRADLLLKKHNEDGMPKLSELRDAATAALANLVIDSEVRRRLEHAIAISGPYCDEIPF